MSSEGYVATQVKCIKCGWEGSTDKCGFGHHDFYCQVCERESLMQVEEARIYGILMKLGIEDLRLLQSRFVEDRVLGVAIAAKELEG